MTGTVGDLQKDVELGQLITNLGQRRSEGFVVDEHAAAAVLQQVKQFLGDVAVVHVERRDAGLVCAEHAFEILVAVVEIDAEVVLTGLVIVEKLPADRVRHTAADQIIGQATGTVCHLTPRPGPVPPDNARAVRNRSGKGFMDVGFGEIKHRLESVT